MTEKEAAFLRGRDLRHMFLEACYYFDLHKDYINELNVFPVPDGDTGTNMSLTMKAAAKELEKNNSDSIGEVAKVAAQSSLMGARGNSGVILAQLFRGIARGLSGKKEAQLAELGKAFQYGIVYAYNAVSKPVEGTILTVAREIARGSREALQTPSTFIDLLQIAINSGRKALERTPDLLPVLKEAGVVDAGGLGLVVFLEGCLQSMLKRTEEERVKTMAELFNTIKRKNLPEEETTIETALEGFNPEYPYCTELIIKGSHLSAEKVRRSLEEWGDSLLVAGEEELVKVHIHTGHPGNVLEACLLQGSIHDVKIENMIDQYRETRWARPQREDEKNLDLKALQARQSRETSKTPAALGVVAISSGKGLLNIFASLGADKIISGGQTMNPSVKEIVEAIIEVPASKVIVLPNNSNIMLSAEQAAELVQKEVAVVDTASIPEGLAALLALDKNKTLAENYTEMCKRARQIKTAEVTFATRDAVVNNFRVTKGNIIGISGNKLITCGERVNETTLELVRSILAGDEEVLTLFYGEDVTTEQAQELAECLGKEYPGVEIELHNGGQPLYYYFISAE